MNPRRWTLVGVFGFLLCVYAWFFTEWFSPAPIDVASQVRFAIQPPHFGRSSKKPAPAGAPGQTNQSTPSDRAERAPKEVIDPAPGGAANVTFSLDQRYRLTRIRVEDIPADGSTPKVMWEVAGKSDPTHGFLYGRPPEGMQPTGVSTNAELLTPGAPYRLLIEAGRRKGTNAFTTTALRPGQ